MKSTTSKLKLDMSAVNSKSSKTSIDKLLIKTLHDTSPDISSETQLTSNLFLFLYLQLNSSAILEGFNNYSGSMQGHELSETLLKFLRTHQPRLGVLKALFIAHHVLHIDGEDFSKIFLTNFFTNVVSPSQSNTNQGNLSIAAFRQLLSVLDDHLYGIFGISYYNLFVSYSNYYDEIQEFSKIGRENILGQLRKGSYQYIVQLLTYKNIIKYFLYVRNFSPLAGFLTNLSRQKTRFKDH